MSTRLEWQGAFLDGRSPMRRPAAVRVMQSGLEIALPDGRTLWWPYGEIRQTQGFYAGEQIRLERGAPLPEALVIDDQAFLLAVNHRGHDLSGRFHNPAHRPLRLRLTIYAAVAVMIGAAAIYFWGIPALAAAVAPRVPVAWEVQLGQSMVEQLSPQELRCDDAERSAVIKTITDHLLAGQPDQPYRLDVIVVNRPVVNALALPGGTIVVFKGLLEKTNRAEELAGVLAHEIQHVLHRHVTQRLLQQASTGLLIAAMTGDVSGAAAYGLKSAEVVGALRFSRQHEAEADLEGLKMLMAAHVDPQGMITFFETLKQEGPAIPDALKYLVTHPQTDDRIRTLTEYVRQHPSTVTPLLPDYDWHRMHDICGRPAPTSS